MKTIGDRIKEKREECGMTQLELANKLDVTDRAVSKWEQNKGNPDITILPKIAEVFGVSLDYLMAGNEPKKEIVLMSKLELCAKNDDPSMIDSLSMNKDENGMGILDYVTKYKSKKVLTKLIDRCSNRSDYMGLFGAGRDASEDVIKIMSLCIPIDRERKIITAIFNSDIRKSDGNFVNALKGKNDYSKRITEGFKNVIQMLVDEYDELSEDQKSFYFGMKPDEESDEENCWFHAYPFFVDYAIKDENKELQELLLNQIEKRNLWVDSSIETLPSDSSWTPYHEKIDKLKKKKIYLLGSTLDYLLSEKEFKLAYRVNSLLENPRLKREIELLEVENDESVDEKEKTNFRCVDSFIIVPSEIEKLRDYSFAKDLIDRNYVNYYEMVFKTLKTDKKSLFKFFVDNNLTELSDYLINNEQEKLLEHSFIRFNDKVGDELTQRQSVIITTNSYISSKNKNCIYYQRIFESSFDIYRESRKSGESNRIIAYFESYKTELLEKVKTIIEAEEKEKQDKIDRAKQVKGLTRDYFENLLGSEDKEMFAIKLCSLFDAIIRFDFKCDAADFCGRMNQFFEKGPKSRQCDDGWGYMVLDQEYENGFVKPWEENKKLMNELRMMRNSIVHPESSKQNELNDEELKKCLDFVFQINEKGIEDE